MFNQLDIQDIITIAKEAGDAIMQVYKQDFEVGYKKDSSPLTLADKKANDIIEASLNQLSVNIPILSEESKEVPYEERRHWEYFWLVDPLDGTKEFIKKNGEFTVNIALVYKNFPVLGVVYAPALGTCYWATKDAGAFRDGQKLPFLNRSNETYRIVASRSHMSDATQAFIDRVVTDKNKELVNIGSSLKICLVAEGSADIYPRLGPTMEWDTAAAHVIVNESGKNLYRYDNGSLSDQTYNKKQLLNCSFIVM